MDTPILLTMMMMMMMMMTETQLGDGDRVDRDRDTDAAVRDDDHRGRGVGDRRLRLLRSEGSNPFCSTLLASLRPPRADGMYRNTTLQATLSGTFLQTLSELVTPLEGHSLSPSSCPPTRSAPFQRFQY